MLRLSVNIEHIIIVGLVDWNLIYLTRFAINDQLEADGYCY